MRAPLLVLAMTTGGLAIAAGYLAHQVGLERDRVRTETTARQRLEARVKELEQVRTMLEMQIPDPGAPVAQASSAQAASERNLLSSLVRVRPQATVQAEVPPGAADGTNAARNAAVFNLDRHRDWMRTQLENPETRAALRGQHKAGTRMSFADLGTELNLTPEQEDKLFDLLADQQIRTMEATMQAPDADPAARKTTFEQVQSEGDVELQTFLGPERYEQFKEYQQTLPERMELREFRGLLDAGNALRDNQARDLMRIMREERERTTREMPQTDLFKDGAPDAAAIARMAEESLKQAEMSSRRVRERAAQVLTPEQLRRFNQIYEQRLNMQRMATRMSREQSSSGDWFVRDEATAVKSQ